MVSGVGSSSIQPSGGEDIHSQVLAKLQDTLADYKNIMSEYDPNNPTAAQNGYVQLKTDINSLLQLIQQDPNYGPNPGIAGPGLIALQLQNLQTALGKEMDPNNGSNPFMYYPNLEAYLLTVNDLIQKSPDQQVSIFDASNNLALAICNANTAIYGGADAPGTAQEIIQTLQGSDFSSYPEAQTAITALEQIANGETADWNNAMAALNGLHAAIINS